MLSPELVNELLEPVAGEEPSGADLEYDPAFMALMVAAEGKAEQQFGDTVIAAVEPEWPQVEQHATELLRRTKDVRCAVLLLRAATRQQGLEGTWLGLELLAGLLDRFWGDVHPRLDADDDGDPTMRLNALAALNDESAVVRDLYDARLGVAAGIGPIRVRDVAIARGALSVGEGATALSAAAVQGGLDDILSASPQILAILRGLKARVDRVAAIVAQRCTHGETLDLARLRGVAHLLGQALPDAGAPADEAQAGEGEIPSAAATTAPAVHGEIRSRQDALQTLDRVIHYLEQSEPGNPAPLLIARAKTLIGVSFLDIMANLAPNALESIEIITGPRPEA